MRAASFLHHEHLAYGRPGLRRLGAVDRQVLEAQVGPYPEHVAGTLRRVLRAGTDPAEDGPVPTVTPDTEHTAPGELPSAVLGDGRDGARGSVATCDSAAVAPSTSTTAVAVVAEAAPPRELFADRAPRLESLGAVSWRHPDVDDC